MLRALSFAIVVALTIAVVGFIAVATLSVFFWTADAGVVALPVLAVVVATAGLRFKKSLRLDQLVRSTVSAPRIFNPTVSRWLADRSRPRRVLPKLGLAAAFVCGGSLGVLLGMPGVAPAPPAPPLPTPAPPTLASFAGVSEPPAGAPLIAQPLPLFSVEAAKPAPTNPPPSADIQTLSSDEVLEVQAWLKAFGFDPGPLDGMRGPQTVAAVKRYQAARQKDETGLLDRSLLQQVRQHAGHSSR